MVAAVSNAATAVWRNGGTPLPGPYLGVSFEEYAKWPATNWHTLKPFAVSALQGRHEMAIPLGATKPMLVGGAFHSALLEPEIFKCTYAVMPEFEGHPNSNAYKAQKAAWIDANGDKVALTRGEMSAINGMQRAVAAHPTASALIQAKGRNELSLVWRDKETDELCKGRIDRLCRVKASIIDANATGDAICLVDLKKTSSLHRFDNEVGKYSYHAQLAFYEDGVTALESTSITPVIIAVQDEPPHDVVVFTAADAVEHGRKLYRRLLQMLVSCRKSERWPGMCPTGTVPIILPKYAQEGD